MTSKTNEQALEIAIEKQLTGTCLEAQKGVSEKEYRKRNGSGAVYDDPRVAVGAGRFDEVGARAEA